MMSAEFESRWKHTPLRDLCSRISSGGTPSRQQPQYFVSNGNFWVKSKELLDGSIYDTEEKITDEAIAKSSAKFYPENTVLLAMYGANVGQLAILRRRATVNQAICGLVVDGNTADYRYVFYALLQTRTDLTVQAFGAAQQNLNQETIRGFAIPTPPFPIQRKIAAVLSAYDDLIENNTRRIQILEDMAQALYREWFVDFRFPGHEQSKMVESVLGPIPKGWEVVPFTNVADVLSGGTPKTTNAEYWGGGIPFFTPKDASGSFYAFETERNITQLGLTKCSSKLYGPDTVFITARGTVGQVIMPAVPMAMSQSSYALKSRLGDYPLFLFMQTRASVDMLKQNAHGAVFDTIIVDTFRKLKAIRPTDAVIKLFEVNINPLFDQMKNLLGKNKNLRQTRDLLLPKLISGEVDVTDLDITMGEMETGGSA